MDTKKDIVVYTAIFGNKDNLIEPKKIPQNCDFVCFTDSELKSNFWKIKKVEVPVKNDPVRSARMYKILAHKFLPEYEYSIWVDGNLLIRGDLAKFVDRSLGDANMAVYSHANYKSNPGHSKLQSFLNIFLRKYEFSRNCVYEEAEALLKTNKKGIFKDDPEVIKRQMEKYRAENYPAGNTLIQSSVLVRRHNALDVIKTMEDWWREVMGFSRRDQLSFNYVAWKNKLNFVYIKGDPRKNRYFFRLPHVRKNNF